MYSKKQISSLSKILCPFQVVISALFASAMAAPTATVLPAGTVALPHAAAYAGVAPLAHAAPIAAAPVVAAGYAAHAVAPAAISLPAPHTTVHKEPDVVTHHKPEPIVTKQVHLGQTSYISGYATEILKPAIPDFKIAVPTALKGTQSVSAPIVTVQKEIHTVNEPVHVEKPYEVPYDVIKHVEKIVEVPTPYHVAKPVAVPHPVPVAGEPIIQKVQGAPIVRNHHHVAHAAPALGYAHHAVAGVPVAAGHAVAGVAGLGYAGLPIAAHAA